MSEDNEVSVIAPYGKLPTQSGEGVIASERGWIRALLSGRDEMQYPVVLGVADPQAAIWISSQPRGQIELIFLGSKGAPIVLEFPLGGEDQDPGCLGVADEDLIPRYG